jgi:hypothetical protein
VSRLADDGEQAERRLEAIAARFGGRFAGT